MKKMIETIAFDFGQVIGFFDHGRTLKKLAAYTDMSECAMFAAIYDGVLEDQFESGHVSEQEFLRSFRIQCRLRCDDAFLAAAFADVFWPNEPLCALLPQLGQRYRLVLGSNTNPVHARRFMSQFAGTLRHFDGLVLSHEIGARKPSRVFFEKVLQVGACAPEQCVFVDDLPDNIAGARAGGLHGIVYSDMEDLRFGLGELGVSLPDVS